MHWTRGCVSQHALGRGGVYPCMYWVGVSAPGGGICPGVSAWGCLPGRSARGAVCPRECVCHTPPSPLWTEWQTPVKTLPCRNCVVNGQYNCPPAWGRERETGREFMAVNFVASITAINGTNNNHYVSPINQPGNHLCTTQTSSLSQHSFAFIFSLHLWGGKSVTSPARPPPAALPPPFSNSHRVWRQS